MAITSAYLILHAWFQLRSDGRHHILPPFEVAFAVLAPVQVFTFQAFRFDKFQGYDQVWRVKESTLVATALLGGWPAGWLAMLRFNHKVFAANFLDKYVAATG